MNKKRIRDARDFIKQWSNTILLGLMPVTLQTKFEEGKETDLDDSEISFLYDAIPEEFSTNYVHFLGLFYLIDFESKKLKPVDFESICDKRIFDASRSNVYSLLRHIDTAVEFINTSIESYKLTALYDPRNYTIERKISTPYDEAFSITREQSAAMNEWQKAHLKKYHKKGFGYRGASPVSVFEIRMGSCSLGTYATCVCTSCLEKAKNAEEAGDTKNAEKIRKNAEYEVFNNM